MSPENLNTNPSRWSLQDLFSSADSPEMEAAFKKAEKMVADFEKRRADLTDAISLEKFLEIIKELEALSRQITIIGDYSELWFTEDT